MKIEVYITTTAQQYIGEVDATDTEDYIKKAEALWESQDNDYPNVNISNDFELNDWSIDESVAEHYFKDGN